MSSKTAATSELNSKSLARACDPEKTRSFAVALFVMALEYCGAPAAVSQPPAVGWRRRAVEQRRDCRRVHLDRADARARGLRPGRMGAVGCRRGAARCRRWPRALGHR